MTKSLLRGGAAILLACSIASGAAAQSQAPDNQAASAAQTQSECPAAKPKKRAFGLGGLLSAARRAGVGDMLNNRMGGGMLGNGKGGQIASALAGTAVEAASSAAQNAASGQGSPEAAPAACTTPQGTEQ